jgi:flagellar motor protein MotB
VENTKPIIIIKKKVAHGGHHGGAWKVSYADFVTAMMALFIASGCSIPASRLEKPSPDISKIHPVQRASSEQPWREKVKP